jgi:Glycosyltransferase family 87
MQRALAPATTLPQPRPRSLARPAAAAVAAASLAAALGASTWLVLAAAQRRSVLSPPSIRVPGAPAWLLGPLSGALPHLATDPRRLHADYTIALSVLFVAWIVAWVTAKALPVAVVAASAALAQLVFFLGPPQPLTDFFNYIVYGRMAAHGLNPYTHAPVRGAHGAAYALSNWHHLPSPYGPLFTLLCEPISVLPLPVAYWVLKAVIVGAALGTLALVGGLARRLGRSPQRALACAALCPATLALGVGGFHNDMPAILCLVGAAACLVQARSADGARWDVAAGALVVIAAGLRPPFAVVVPLVVLGARRRMPALAGAAAAGAVVGLVMLVAFHGALPALKLQGRLVTPLSVPNLLGVAAGRGGADATVRALARDTAALLAVGGVLVVARRPGRALPAIAIVLLTTVVALPWVMPWYLAWSLPFVALGLPRRLAPAAVLVCVWLVVGATPQIPQIMHAFGFYPTRSTTGMANHLLEQRLVR